MESIFALKVVVEFYAYNTLQVVSNECKNMEALFQFKFRIVNDLLVT